jgi:hypothetical protein
MRRRIPIMLAVLLALTVALPAAAHHYHGWYGGAYWGPGWGGYWGPAWGGYWGPAWGGTVVVTSAYPPSAPPSLGIVDTDVSPERALVYLDDDLIGTADDFDGFPDYLYLKPGHYKLEFRLGGFTSKLVELDVEPGQYYPMDYKLERVPGQKVSPWWDEPKGLPTARVFGPKKGGEREPVQAAPDPGLRPETGGAPDAEAAQLSRHGAALELRIKPGNASVYLDGELMGTGEEMSELERGLAVKPGKHHLDILAPGYSPRALDVEVPSGERQQVVVELEKGAGQGRPEALE